jgi:ABC-2 type transport system permease protein
MCLPASAGRLWLSPTDGSPHAAFRTRLDPLTRGIDGLRGTLIGLTHFGVSTDIAVLAVVAAVFVALGAHAFSRIQI